ncbi:hypothetical protein ACQVP2_34210 [Methylobacterium aquaticum]|uniref:hypothetical protein n=1 Tax=Methylobacterium aquaticum TaxID=270351 RepID=UPI003D16DF1F
MDTSEYTVTDQAGPKVAGRVAASGDILTLTEPEARAELLAGAIVPKGADSKAAPSQAGTKRLADTQARARGADSAKAEAAAEPSAQS